MEQKSVLSSLHASTNVHPIVIRLPTEILEDIFIQCASDYHREYDGRPIYAAPSWVNVSYVCHRWRNVALNCATIWTYYFTMSKRWTEELLARSRQASLQIRISISDMDEPRFMDTVGKVMDHLERIQELHLEVPIPYDYDVIDALSSRAPCLQSLKITLNESYAEWPWLPFDGVPPALHTLELSDCLAPELSSFKLNALTTLRLCGPLESQWYIEDFLPDLVYMKDLRHLYLDNFLHGATWFLSSAVFRTFEKIDLPHLSRLWIGAPLSTTVALLSCLNIPLKTTVKLNCDELDIDVRTLCSLLTERYSIPEDHALSSPTILSLVIDTKFNPTLTFSANERDFTTLSNEEWNSNIPLQIKLNPFNVNNVDLMMMISDICCSMSLSNVRSLLIIEPPFEPAFWRRMLGLFQDVRYIELYMGNMPDLSVLSLTDLAIDEGVQNQDGLATGDRDQSHMLAPRLEELVLVRITFLPEHDSNMRHPAITRHSLLDSLSTRRGTHGRLTMTQCTIGNSDKFDSVMAWGDGGIRVVCDAENNEE